MLERLITRKILLRINVSSCCETGVNVSLIARHPAGQGGRSREEEADKGDTGFCIRLSKMNGDE